MRSLILAVIVLAITTPTAPAQPASAVGMSPHAVVQPVPLAHVKWTSGFWADRFETCRTTMIPSMAKIMQGTDHSLFLERFKIASGERHGTSVGPPWNDGDCYKWLESVAAVYSVTPDPALDRLMDDAIETISRAQRADGYIHTPVLIRNRNGDANAKPFQDRLNFEMYNFGHLFTTACVHHRATGKKTLLAVAIKAADFLDAAFRNPTPELARNAVCPAHYMGILDLYRTTGEKRYLRLAEKWLDMRNLVVEGGDDNQDRIPFRDQTEAVGHAVRANYLYAGAADLYAETGDATLLKPLTSIWSNLVSKKLYVTGACGALYDGASPEGSKEQKQITRTHQAYGRNYQLPNSTAHNETCASIGNVLWNARMITITGDAKYADVMELALSNAVLAGISLDGTRFFYTNTLRQLDTMPVALRWSRQREPWISCFCCPPNVLRTIAEVNGLAYGRSPDALWVHLYGSNTLDTELPNGGRVQLTQETEYPWNGRVKFTVKAAPNRDISVKLRIPGWASSSTLTVNGMTPGETPTAGRYLDIKRHWAAGDVIELTLPMRVRLLQANPLVEEARNQVAVQRGPIVYCLESRDLAKDVRVPSVRIPASIDLKPRYVANLLGGVTVLEGQAELNREPTWGPELYRDLKVQPAQSVPIQLVPYSTWGNRGRSEMTVWMPLSP